MDLSAQRRRMVEEQIIARGLQDRNILNAMRTVPRHLFVPESLQIYAYEDRALSIGHDQTISQPWMVAIMLNALALTGREKVLEIGTGGGYQAALLATLAREVHSVEIIPELAERAISLLSSLRFRNVSVYAQDGSGGLPEEAPFDAIIMAAAAPEIPPPLLNQLADGGRLLLPIKRGERDVLTLIQKHGETLEEKTLGECAFVPLRGVYGQTS